MPDEDRAAIERTIEASTHGRYLISAGDGPRSPLLIGFHGYGETAEEELRRLHSIPGIARWTVVSVQGLHQFYRRRTNEIVASWMTRQNRERAIADNIAYASNVVRQITAEYSANPTVVMTGFSQGVAMAFRAAVALDHPVAGVISCGGDVPPELEATTLARIPAALIGRGLRDDWYTAEKLAADQERLQAAGVALQTVVLNAAHEWTEEFSTVCARFLQSSLARHSAL
jgi:predicted esterase